MLHDHDTIVAPATPTGGAIAVVRVSGSGAIETVERIFRGRRPLSEAAGYTLHRGTISDGARLIDDVLVSLFRAPHSYTGEDSVEISCHGSAYVVSEILRLLLDAGARMATPGEFTLRTFLAGKLDLAQAEAVVDLIASSSRAAHTLAAGQLRGGFSKRLDHLRGELLHLASLLELELDFSEEDVEFADRRKLRCTMEEILSEILRLRGSFALGSALKEGIPVAIVGAPNVGKSTLLNRLLNEDRAMVSEIAGTTRDLIEAYRRAACRRHHSGTGRLLPDRGCGQSSPHTFSHRGRRQHGSRRHPCQCCGGQHRDSRHLRHTQCPCGGEPDRTRRNDSRHRP